MAVWCQAQLYVRTWRAVILTAYLCEVLEVFGAAMLTLGLVQQLAQQSCFIPQVCTHKRALQGGQ